MYLINVNKIETVCARNQFVEKKALKVLDAFNY